jgi:hypothetical protein
MLSAFRPRPAFATVPVMPSDATFETFERELKRRHRH